MTRPPLLHPIYVEGRDDVAILGRWFPANEFKNGGGKDQIRSNVDRDPNAWGLLDRDFAPGNEVAASRLPDSRVTILSRYCIENYLLEPDIICAAVAGLSAHADKLAAWTDEGYVRTQLHDWGRDLAHYAAANSILNQWRGVVEAGFHRYFRLSPALSYDRVLDEMQKRLQNLVRPDEVPAALRARYEEVQADIATWDGLHRWINGKVLLEECLYPRAFAVTNLGKQRLRDALTDAGRTRPPMELRELSRKWSG